MSQCRDHADICLDSDCKPQLQRLLNEALNLMDAMSLSPEIGARLQEVIDLIETSLESGAVRREMT